MGNGYWAINDFPFQQDFLADYTADVRRNIGDLSKGATGYGGNVGPLSGSKQDKETVIKIAEPRGCYDLESNSIFWTIKVKLNLLAGVIVIADFTITIGKRVYTARIKYFRTTEHITDAYVATYNKNVMDMWKDQTIKRHVWFLIKEDPEIKFRFCIECMYYVPENDVIDLKVTYTAVFGDFNMTKLLGSLPRLLLTDSCPRLVSYASTGPLGVTNQLLAIFRSLDGNNVVEHIRHPDLGSVAAPKNQCTLINKAIYLNYDLYILIEYFCARYFLWYLIRGKWCTKILLQRNTKRFMSALSTSPYACWVSFLSLPKFTGYESYFLH